MPWAYFSEDELKCKHCDEQRMHVATMEQLVAMRIELGFPFPVRSAYRCPHYNSRVSKTGLNGPHTQGKAVDIQAYGYRAYELVSRAREFGVTGIGIFQLGDHRYRYIHLDWCDPEPRRPRPWVWSY